MNSSGTQPMSNGSLDAGDLSRVFVFERFATFACLIALMLVVRPLGLWLQAYGAPAATAVVAALAIGALLVVRLAGPVWIPALLAGRRLRVVSAATWAAAGALTVVFYAFSGSAPVLAIGGIAAVAAVATACGVRRSPPAGEEAGELPLPVRALLELHGFDRHRVRIAPESLDEAASLVRDRRGPWILISPDVVESFTEREMAVVVGHELGHVRQRARLAATGIALGEIAAEVVAAAAVLVAAGAWGGGAVYMLPSAVAAVALVETVEWPVGAWLWRRQERDAHRFALQATGDVEAFVSVMHKLHRRQGSLPEPRGLTKWLASHPSLGDALAQAAAFDAATSSA